MLAPNENVPTTPTPIPQMICVLDIDHERRLRREGLREGIFRVGTTMPISSKAFKRTNPLPVLIDEDYRSTKRQCVVTPCTEILKRRMNFANIKNTLDSDLFHLRPRRSSEFFGASLDEVERTLTSTRSKWDEPVSRCSLRPRNLHHILETSTNDDDLLESSMSTVCLSSSASLPYMPL